jgi:adenylate cyclase
MTLAGPGEIVASAALRDELIEHLDADIEDLGDREPQQVDDLLDPKTEYLGACILKHVAEPVRAYRIGSPGPRPVIEPGSSSTFGHLKPTIAVIPFKARGTDHDQEVLGEVLADDVISALSRSPDLQLISRLSTTAFRNRDATLAQIAGHLKANYVLTGEYRVRGATLEATPQLAVVSSGEIVWGGETLKCEVKDLLNGDDEMIRRLVNLVRTAVRIREVERARFDPLPTLPSYTRLMGAITLMHRGSSYDFERAGQLLESLTELLRMHAAPHAWLAKWHVLRFNRGLAREDEKEREAKIALASTNRALDLDSNCSLALTIDGFIHTNLLKNLDVGLRRYDAALSVNPNESLALLFRGTLHAFRGEGTQAVEDTERALMLSPLDPLRYYYESLAATAAHSAGQYERAIDLAKRSLRSNRVHPSTLRALAIAQSQLGLMEEARRTIEELRELTPNLTVRSYLADNPSSEYETGKVWSEALRRAGLPE